ncbi:MAG: cobalt-precorrin-5B (C(1))-methyltransferase CbiD, partial [Puniceicoccales bacterium]
RSVNLDGHERISPAEHRAWSIKDAGEDVDNTHGLTLSTTLIRSRTAPTTEEIQDQDFCETIGGLSVILRAGAGVGLVTRKGLDVPPGKPAINPTPRRMLLENLHELNDGQWKSARIEVSILRGEEVARRTLNHTLGIVNGLSILGTSGLVIPCSHAAYIATIEILIRGAALHQFPEVALVTGGRSHRWLKTHYPTIEDQAIVRFGDFIEQSLDLCSQHHIPRVRIVCMVGKLAKYALGITNTHADRSAQSPPRIAEQLIRHGLSKDKVAHASQCRSARELLQDMDTASRRQAIQILKALAQRQLESWAAPCPVHLHVLDTNGTTELP